MADGPRDRAAAGLAVRQADGHLSAVPWGPGSAGWGKAALRGDAWLGGCGEMSGKEGDGAPPAAASRGPVELSEPAGNEAAGEA